MRTSPRFVSRGGNKLQGALKFFRIDVAGRVCVDLGTSTGGFVDCLLHGGAARVYAFDVGTGQIAWKLATDPRVVLRDDYNVRRLHPEDIPQPFFLLTADLSFISLRRVLPPLSVVVREKGELDSLLLLLVKPQFELPPRCIAPGGLVADPDQGKQAVADVALAAASHGFVNPDIFPSPVKGAKGNQEYFMRLALK